MEQRLENRMVILMICALISIRSVRRQHPMSGHSGNDSDWHERIENERGEKDISPHT